MSVSKQKKKLALFGSLRALACSAVLVAMSIVCGKYLAFGMGNVLRFSFENLPILVGGILFGPLAGAAIGVCADLIGCMLVGYEINPLVMLGASSIGLFAGLAWRITKKLPYGVRVLCSLVSAHLVGSVLLKTIGLAAFYSMPLGILMLWRGLNYLIIGTLEYLLLYFILKNKGVRSVLMRQ